VNLIGEYLTQQLLAEYTGEQNTFGAAYSDMMNSGDPEQWLKDNGRYLTQDEIAALSKYLPAK
jgi:hypothetical protein